MPVATYKKRKTRLYTKRAMIIKTSLQCLYISHCWNIFWMVFQTSKDNVSKNRSSITPRYILWQETFQNQIFLLWFLRIANFYIFMAIWKYFLCLANYYVMLQEITTLLCKILRKLYFLPDWTLHARKIKILPSTKNCPKSISFSFVELFPLFYTHFYYNCTILSTSPQE